MNSYARRKLMEKKVDMIAANLVGSVRGGFDREDNELTVVWRGGQHHIALTSKRRAAVELVSLLLQYHGEQKDNVANG